MHWTCGALTQADRHLGTCLGQQGGRNGDGRENLENRDVNELAIRTIWKDLMKN